MLFFRLLAGKKRMALGFTMMALGLTACAPVDDTIGSHLAQPPPGSVPQKPADAGDIAIVGQEVAHGIMDLPAISDATTPPMVQFTGVTSIVDKPVDTAPYTELLRDRLLLLTREKLRFVERTLPPLLTSKKKIKSKKDVPPPVEISTDPDYRLLAELRGRFEDDYYKVQVQFVDAHTGDVLFNGLYRIHKETGAPSSSDDSMMPPPSDANTPPPPSSETGTTSPL